MVKKPKKTLKKATKPLRTGGPIKGGGASLGND